MKPVVLPAASDALLLTGVVDEAVPALSCEWLADAPGVVVLLDARQKALEAWLEDLRFFHHHANAPFALKTACFPEVLEDGGESHAFEAHCDQLSALALLAEEPTDKPCRRVLALNPRGLFQSCPGVDSLRARARVLKTGANYDFADLPRHFAEDLGYDCEAVCERPGQFALRGGLIDIYPLNADAPVRLDFFGSELESIRPFDPATQRSEGSLAAVLVAPSQGNLPRADSSTLLDHLPRQVLWLVREPARLVAEYPEIFHRPENIQAPAANFFHVIMRRPHDLWRGIAAVDTGEDLFSTARTMERFTESLDAYAVYQLANGLGVVREEAAQRSRSDFLRQLGQWAGAGHAIHMVAKNEASADRIRAIVEQEGLTRQLRARFIAGDLTQGFRWTRAAGGSEVYVTEAELLGRNRVRIPSRRRRMAERPQVDQLLDFAELSEGDHLVHHEHGICLYRGLRTLELDGSNEEVLSLEFAEGIVLHLPLHESHLLSRYVGLAKVVPKLGRVGGNQWAKTRHAAERATLDMAAGLLRLQAQRETVPGHACAPDHPWQKQFEDAFEHVETPDQQRAIDDCKQDLEKAFPMDRLICGDVGFGKTEVAIRAAFKIVLDGKQVAFLAPTTVLCQQHFNTLRDRFAGYPVVVEMLSRFRRPAQKKEILQQLRGGRIDILVGTHSILGKDVVFGDLGLLVIDEEHRFGVRHKEKLKHLRAHVDVLTMSATPIPRTLQFALMGARALSVIETPPRDRLPIETVVRGYDPDVVRRAIEYEIGRGGQVFYLHNRVATIASVARRLGDMLPGIRIAVGHGQMGEQRLERLMTDFVAGRYQVLVCTTIIESGLDIPNCNTLIIEGADRFGLSQLYQIRGRVGRFNRQAYAYLLLHRHTHLMEKARKRLGAIRQFNQLGAGFRIAMRDLELRGAGNLLGARQSGHIAGVGFDLYCQLLRQSVARLKGDPQAARVRASVHLDFIRLGPPGPGDGSDENGVKASANGYEALKQRELHEGRTACLHACLPPEYIGEATLRIEFHRKLSLAVSMGEVGDVADTLKDRFGRLPDDVRALLIVTEIRVLAEQNGLVSVQTESERLKCRRAAPDKRGQQYIQVGRRFPRLTKRRPMDRLIEIKKFLQRLNSSTL